MKNKILLLIIIILIPITIISFQKKTNFIMEEEPKQEENIEVNYNGTKIPLDEYVYNVVGAEMPASFHEEALKAQILATRTFTINKIYKNKEYQFTKSDQAYQTEEELKEKWQDDYEKYHKLITKLIEETKNEIITYNNNPIEAYYFSMSNGYTENSLEVFGKQEDYLVSVSSELENESISKFNYEITISIENFTNKLNINTPIDIQDIQKDESNRIKKIIINNKEFTGIEIRKLLNLRSTDFEINILDSNVQIKTKGYGHGVGMSQYGANELAKQGYSYKEIIKHYYKNVEISKINV